jgi:hypothetical protein
MLIAMTFTHDIHPTFAWFGLGIPGLSNALIHEFDRSIIVKRLGSSRNAVRSFVESDEAYLLVSAELPEI